MGVLGCFVNNFLTPPILLTRGCRNASLRYTPCADTHNAYFFCTFTHETPSGVILLTNLCAYEERAVC